jgi:general secretion pathway protein I
VTGKRGFTLLEMVVATLIMAIAVVGLLSGISGATRNAARLRQYDRAVQLARLRMNDLLMDYTLPRNTVVSGTFDPDLTGGIESGWRARLENFEMPPARAAGQLALDRIELEIWWASGNDRRTLALDAFRSRVLRPVDVAPGAPQ